MKIFMWSDCDFWCCHVLMQLFLMSTFYTNVLSKCMVNKQEVTCFGSTWKQDLLPVENHSLMKLYISKCTDSRAQTNTLEINFLRNVSRLKLLSITNCALTRLPLANYPINSIEIIDLSNNRIESGSQFPDTLKRFPNLKILNLANNRLTHLPKSWFDCPNQIETLILDGNQIAGLNPSLAACFVNLKRLSLRGNQFERLRVPSDIRKSSTGSHINEAGGLRLFSDPGALISQGNKKEPPRDEMAPRGRHDYHGVLPQFKVLKSLDLSHNRIKSIDQIPLSKLENLNQLNLSHNQLSSKTASGQSENECDFGTAPFYINGRSGLIDLDLSSNPDLMRIHSCWTFGLKNLQILRIKNCSLSSISESSFEKMKSLTLLDLSHNKLGTVPKELMVVSKSLKWLSLAYNNISQISAFYLSAMDNLQTLNLSHNQFQNLMTFPISESEVKLSDAIGEFGSSNRDSSSEEPINLLGQMKQLHGLDLSFNDFLKISAISDLSPSIRSDGELQRIDLRGNPSLTQFVDFNANDITTFLTEFLIDPGLKLHCDCLMVGFLKWINLRRIDVLGRCATPAHLSHLSTNEPQLINSLVNDQSCKGISSVTSPKPPYRLKLTSNANLSLDSSQPDNDPMDSSHKRSANQKRQVDYQKWVMTGRNLTLRCQFYSTYPLDGPVTIEWQRIKQTPIETVPGNSQGGSPFLKEDKSDQFDVVKYREKIEHLSSNYDLRIKITQMGPIDDESGIEKLQNSDESPKHGAPVRKYIGSLLLKPIFVNDMGRYRCLINGLPTTHLYGQSQLISKEENIKVYTPPRFTSIPMSPMAIIEGDTAEITCRAIGNPSPMTSLGKLGTKDFPAARARRMKMYKDDSSFFITNVSQIDTGNYSCTSRNAAGTISHNFTLKVQVPAIILNRDHSRQTVKIGEALIIDFKVNGVPRPDVKWFKDDIELQESDRIRFSSDHLMLIIQSTILSDAGLYKISVMNALSGKHATVSVGIIDSHGHINPGPGPAVTDPSPIIPDYWLSGIIIIVILSILVTSILWITIFFCFSRIIGSKKRRLLLISNSQSRGSFDKTQTTTSFTNPRALFKPLGNSSIPLSLTSSTIVPRDQSQDNIDSFTNSSKSEFHSPQVFHNFVTPYGTNRCLSQPYLLNSGVDLTKKVSESSLSRQYEQRGSLDPCDSGIDSSQVYSETVNSTDIPQFVYQCRHKPKARPSHQKPRKRYMCSNSSDSIAGGRPRNGDRIMVAEKRSDEDERVELEISNEANCDEEELMRHNLDVVRQYTSPLMVELGQQTS